MTLHITTFMPNHIVSVSDRLLSVASHNNRNLTVELADDQYKHIVLICDNAKTLVSFTGIAGLVRRDEDDSHYFGTFNSRLVD